MNCSICIATYNGEKFVKEQIVSILKQISDNDEIIITDDCSTDQTINIIKEFKDPRINIFVNDKKLGHQFNFEQSLLRCSKEIIFFCDQDDIWCDFKYRLVMREFSENKDLILVHHRFSTFTDKIIYLNNEYKKDAILIKSKMSKFYFIIKQLYSCEIWGCATAFRNSLKNSLIPFPVQVYSHDHWLALTAPLYGSILLMSDILLYRRLHNYNLTPPRRRNIFLILISRFVLMYLLFINVNRYLKRYIINTSK